MTVPLPHVAVERMIILGVKHNSTSCHMCVYLLQREKASDDGDHSACRSFERLLFYVEEAHWYYEVGTISVNA